MSVDRNPFVEIVGDTLLQNEILPQDATTLLPALNTVSKNTSDVLVNKHVLLYFGGAWTKFCPLFSAALKPYCVKLQEKGIELEVVYVSGDPDATSFKEYFATMPWFAVPYEDEKLRMKLVEDYNIKTIPTAILLDPQGNVLCDNTRPCIMGDPNGDFFPYPKLSLREILQGPFIKPDGSTLPNMDSKYVAVFFNASYYDGMGIEDARPALAQAYAAAIEKGFPLEVLFLSEENDTNNIASVFKSMPWAMHPLHLVNYMCGQIAPFINREGEGLYSQSYRRILIVDPNRNIINHNAYGDMCVDPTAEHFPWRPRLVSDITNSSRTQAGHLALTPSFLVFFEDMDKEQQDSITRVLETEAVNWISGEQKTAFFTVKYKAEKSCIDLISKIRQESDTTNLREFALMLDVPERKCYVHQGQLDVETLHNIVTRYWDGTLELKAFQKSMLEIFQEMVRTALDQLNVGAQGIYNENIALWN